MNEMSTEKLINHPFSLIGTPFKYGGRGNGYYDCYGLVIELYRRLFNIELPDYQSPTTAREIAKLMRGELHLWRPTEHPRRGTVMFMKLGEFTHVAMYLGENRFIHTCEATGGVCIERMSNWFNKIERYFEYAPVK